MNAYGAGTKMVLKIMKVENSQYSGVWVGRYHEDGPKLDATGCQFHQNGQYGMYVEGSTTTARLTNCTSHHNKYAGVYAECGAVVDLMGDKTSVHENEGSGCAHTTVAAPSTSLPTLRSQRHVPRKQERKKYL